MVLPAPEGPTRATSWPGSAVKVTSKRTCWEAVVSSTATDSSEASETSSAAGYRKSTWSNSMRAGPAGTGRASGFVLDHGREIEDLEDPVEGDQGGHHVDLHVGQRGEGAVEAGQVGGQGHHRPQLQACR